MLIAVAATILGVRVPYTKADVERAFQEYARKIHPDSGNKVENAGAVMAAGVQAKKTLIGGKGSVTQSPSVIAAMISRAAVAPAARSETEFHRELQGRLETPICKCLTVHGHAYQEGGWPDLQVYSAIWSGQLELKVRDNQMSAIQVRRFQELRRANANVWVCREIGDDFVLEDEYCKVFLRVINWRSLNSEQLLRRLAQSVI